MNDRKLEATIREWKMSPCPRGWATSSLIQFIDALIRDREYTKAALSTPEGYRGVVEDAIADELETVKGKLRRFERVVEAVQEASRRFNER